MSECICSKCPSTFKFSDGEGEEYLCLVDESVLHLEHRVCMEQLGRMNIFSVINTGKKLTDEQQKFLDLNINYWNEREKIITAEFNRRKAMK